MGKAALERPGLIQCQATEQRSGSLAQDFMGVPQQILVWEGKGGLVYSLSQIWYKVKLSSGEVRADFRTRAY